ncbi:MAG: methyltransferase domain-containing protein [Desulfuromonadales bacterium]|nr:methyltransferase domain-containing protein [Desulfuromonadales bacterium]
MNERGVLFDEYLTQHLSHAGNSELHRKHKKAMLLHNYGHLLPDNKSARILDIGPGYGELLELLSIDLSYKCVKTVDLSCEVVKYCNTLVPNSSLLVKDTCNYLDTHPKEFDCIFLMHILEHIPKDKVIPFLLTISKALAPSGRIIVEVPNMNNFFTGIAMRYNDFTHEVGFTELSLSQVFRMAGLSNIQISEVNQPVNRVIKIFQVMMQSLIKLVIRMIFKTYRMPGNSIFSISMYGTAIKRKY